MQCCVFTRFVYDVPYLDSFIEHYLNIGFDKIFILYHDVVPYHLSENLIEEVEIILVENNGNKLLNEYKHLFLDDFDWVLNVDSDEFLILHEDFPSIKDYMLSKFEEDENINMFQFSWAWLHAFNPPIDFTLTDILKKYQMFIGSKDTKDKTNNKIVWVKSLTKVEHIEYITCHNCVLNVPAVIHVDKRLEYHAKNANDSEENILIEGNFKGSDDESEDDENKSINLLPRCYTKRNRTYNEAALVHINTRNMTNAIIKGLNIHVTQVKRKRIKNLKRLKKFINNFDLSQPVFKETLDEFSKCIGYKIKFPLMCLEKDKIHKKIGHLNFGTKKLPFCNIKYIPEQQDIHLEDLQERMKGLFCVLDMEKFLKILNAFAILFDNTFSAQPITKS